MTYIYSYGMMMLCWQTLPEDRPSFKELYLTISNHIEHIAGYLQLGINPFTGREMGEGEGEGGSVVGRKGETQQHEEEEEVQEEEEIEEDDSNLSIKLISSSV